MTFTTGTTDTSIAVTTDEIVSVGESSTTLSGGLTDSEGVSAADITFDEVVAGNSFTNETIAQTLSNTGGFSALLDGLVSAIDYEFRKVVTARDNDT